MALPANADVRFLLSRIRAGADYRWKGGPPSDFTLVDWRDLSQREPTEAEYATEQVIVDAEETTQTTTRTAQRTRTVGTEGLQPSALTLAQVTALLEEVLQRFDGLERDGTIKSVDDWKRI